ncbi:MAG: exodeoxyribonuclease VII large subunit [Mycoplasmatales bacterium]
MVKDSKLPALTPSAINEYLKQLLEADRYLKRFRLVGEISNLKYHTNGNIYFALKDANATINCMMFQTYAKKLSFKLIDGQQVELDGSIYVYTKAGQYNINVYSITEVGQGNLYQQFLKLKKELAQNGYFSSEHKQKIPLYPQTIGIVTSPTGAAIRDILSTLKRRYPIAKLLIIPALVQGGNAAANIAKQIERANLLEQIDVLIVGRGGGSIEDLWPFNEEIVVQAIFNSKIPIISAVGHETDTTLADFVADVRAETPTAAAVLATPDIEELKEILKKNKHFCLQQIETKIQRKYDFLKLYRENNYLKTPLIQFQIKMDQMSNQLVSEQKNICNRLTFYEQRLNIILNNRSMFLNNQLASKQLKLSEIVKNQKFLIENHLKQKEQQLLNSRNYFNELNPLTILMRGYSATTNQNGEIIKSISQVSLNEKIAVEVSDGVLTAIVEKINTKEKTDGETWVNIWRSF